MYAMGNFEYALMFFHRGCHLRADNGEFQIGIQKSQEAIENAIGESEWLYLIRIGAGTGFSHGRYFAKNPKSTKSVSGIFRNQH